MRVVFTFLLGLVMLVGFSQNLINGGFETIENNKAVGWISLTGDCLPSEKVELAYKQDNFIIEAFEGDYFMMLRNNSLVATMKSARVKMGFRPGSLFFNYIYFPINTNEMAMVDVLLTKWNVDKQKRDTILVLDEIIQPSMNGEWKDIELNLGASYNSSLIPDSAQVWFTVSDSNARKGSTLLLDEVWFSEWAQVGIRSSQQNNYKVWPNPVSSNNMLKVRSLNTASIKEIKCVDALGREILLPVRSVRSNEVHVSTEPIGDVLQLFWLIIQDNNGNTSYQKIIL